MRPKAKIDLKIRKDANFAKLLKCLGRMERSLIRDRREASMPPRISLGLVRLRSLCMGFPEEACRKLTLRR
jgi:hypothetical protein